jgi:hypothetical protein
MGFTQSIASIGLGGIMAWLILSIFQVKNTVSYFKLNPWPLEDDNSNLALVGVGLASAKPKTSVMDATPSSPQVMIMEAPPQSPINETQAPTPPQSPEVVHIAVPVYPSPVAVPMSPAPMAMSTSPASMGSPVTITPQSFPSPSA